jgi:predicted Ser/Thr protein kinase
MANTDKSNEELQAEIDRLKKENQTKSAPQTITPEAIEAQIRNEYINGAVSYMQLSEKYRMDLNEIRRIVGDTDLDPAMENTKFAQDEEPAA